MPHSYFLSYSWYDLPEADHIELLLLRQNRIVNRDEPTIGFGEGLSDTIMNLIERSDTFILLCSTNYFKSKWCIPELKFALSRKKNGLNPARIIPLYVESFEIDNSMMNWEDILSPSGMTRAERALAVNKMVAKE